MGLVSTSPIFNASVPANRVNLQSQKRVWKDVPLLPMCMDMYFDGMLSGFSVPFKDNASNLNVTW